jgi:hypothetical protein
MSTMPVPDPSFGWHGALGAYAVIAVSAFLVTWCVTDVARVRRTAYVGILTLVSVGLGAGYVAASGTSAGDLITSYWAWGILAGVLVAAIFTPGLRRLPSGPRPADGDLIRLLAWEGVVYGIAEAILLAILPVLTVWHAATDLGWTDGASGKVGSGALAIAGSSVVILVHHLGYREFRHSPKMLTMALVACGAQALAFLLTGSVLAPMIAHIALHAQLVLRGNELPRESRTDAGAFGGEPVSRTNTARSVARV